jgi:SAM-dependent methyltransferase
MRAFEELAATYDATFTETVVGRALRDLVWARFNGVFGDSQRILELGCGTGEDAIRLASTGKFVVATDASQRMIQVARHKSAASNLSSRIQFRCASMEQLGPLEGERFDGVLSNFGAINCAADLAGLITDIAARLRPGAGLLWVLMGRHVPWEWLWHLAHGQWRKAWRRLEPNGCQWRGMTIQYPTPGTLTSLLEPYFRVRRVAPLGVLLPPSYAAGWLDRSPVALRLLSRAERWAQRASVLAAMSDHFIVEATRLPHGPALERAAR